MKERITRWRLQAWEFLSRQWVDLLLVCIAIAAMVSFTHLAHRFESEDGEDGALVSMLSGVATRRVPENRNFIPAEEGEKFQNLDTIWVGGGQSASVGTSDGYILDLDQYTMIVFRRPFKSRGDIQTRFRLITGRVTVRTSKASFLMVAPNRFDEMPIVASPVSKQGGNEIHSYPANDSTIYIPAAGTEVPFTWGEVLSGFFVLMDADSGGTRYLPIHNASYLRYKPAGGHKYIWQIVNTLRQPVLGPFRFTLALDSSVQWKPILENPSALKPGAKIDVLLPDAKGH